MLSMELVKIVHRGGKVINTEVTPDGAAEIATRSRGTPRVAVRLLRRVRDFAGAKTIDSQVADEALCRLGVDAVGPRYHGSPAIFPSWPTTTVAAPVGGDTIAAVLSEKRDTIEEVIEPYLLQLGMMQRTPRGRMLTVKALFPHGIEAAGRFFGDQLSLLAEEDSDD